MSQRQRKPASMFSLKPFQTFLSVQSLASASSAYPASSFGIRPKLGIVSEWTLRAPSWGSVNFVTSHFRSATSGTFQFYLISRSLILYLEMNENTNRSRIHYLLTTILDFRIVEFLREIFILFIKLHLS